MEKKMKRKYEFTDETIQTGGKVLHRIKAVRDFGDVVAGELGGFIQSENNLSHEGNAWVGDNARVDGNARIDGNAWVGGYARIDGSARIDGNAWVGGYARINDNARVSGNSRVFDSAWVDGNTYVGVHTRISGNARVRSKADYVVIKGLGHIHRTTTFYRNDDNDIYVDCGCFHGDIQSFREKVKETHKDTKYAKEYLMLADLMELHFGSKQ